MAPKLKDIVGAVSNRVKKVLGGAEPSSPSQGSSGGSSGSSKSLSQFSNNSTSQSDARTGDLDNEASTSSLPVGDEEYVPEEPLHQGEGEEEEEEDEQMEEADVQVPTFANPKHAALYEKLKKRDIISHKAIDEDTLGRFGLLEQFRDLTNRIRIWDFLNLLNGMFNVMHGVSMDDFCPIFNLPNDGPLDSPDNRSFWFNIAEDDQCNIWTASKIIHPPALTNIKNLEA